MTLTRACELEILTDHESLKLSSSADIFSCTVPRDRSASAVIKSLVQFSKTSHSSHDVYCQEARVADTIRDPVLCELFQGAGESSCSCYVRATELVRRFSKALRLVEKLNDDTATEDSSATRCTLGATHLDSAALSSVDEYDMVLYIEAAAALTQNRK